MRRSDEFFRQVNKALSLEFGEGKVWLTPDPDGEYDYLLEFDYDSDWPSFIKPAKKIVREFDPYTKWYDENVRTSDLPYYDEE